MDIPDLIKRQVDSHIRQHVNTAIPAEVVDVSRLQSEQTIDVQPIINRVFEDAVVMIPSVIYNVPVAFPTGNGGIMTFPIAVGDTVLVVFSMRSIEEWLDSDGSRQTPKDRRHHHRTDAIALPGLYTKSTNLSPHPDNVEIKFKNQSISLEPDNTTTITNGVSSVVMNPDGTTVVSDGTSSFNMDGSGGINIVSTTLTHNGTNIGDTHVHGGVQTGGGSTGAPS